MRKFIVSLLVSILCMSMVACSEDTTSNENNTSSSQTSGDNDKTNESAESNIEEEKKEEIKFEEIVVVDNDECVIKITKIEPDSMWGYELKVNLENKSSDKTYMFSVESGAINGVQVDPFFATEVAPEKKANDNLNFPISELEDIGIKDFTDIELTFRVYDSEDIMADEVAYETVHIYPYGEENIVQFIRESKPTDTVLVDNDYVTVIVTGYKDDDIWGYTADLFLINKSDKNIMFSVDEVSVNGYMADPFFADLVSAGKCAFTSISWSDTTFEENGITEVEKIELLFTAHDENDFMSDDFVNETFTLIP